MKPYDSYVICTSPRSGSTLLCKLLHEVGNAGCPDSYFHIPSLETWLGAFGMTRADFNTKQDAVRAVFQAANVCGKADSDIFGMRLQGQSCDFFAQQLSVLHPTLPDTISRIKAVFGNTLYIHLTRENKLDQAISHLKAEQSGLWHMAPGGVELERLSPRKDLVYDADAIAELLEFLEKMDAEWENWFAKEHIEPLRLTYDELSDAPYATLARVLEALGLEATSISEKTPPVAKLADDINHEWAARFRADTKL